MTFTLELRPNDTSMVLVQQTGTIFSQFGVINKPWSLFFSLLILLLWLWAALRALEWAWLRPRRLERLLRQQGLRGTAYRSLAGDVKENTQLNEEARRINLMPLSHHITARVEPLLHRTMKEYGKHSFTWYGPYPRVTIRDPKLVRQILSNKFGDFEKQKVNRFVRLLADGLLIYEGEKWGKHRRILNPAFHLHKLKNMLPAFCTCCEELVERWEKSVGPDGSFEVDVWPELQNFAGDVISRAAFGSSYQEGRYIFQLQSEQAECLAKAFRTLYIPLHWYLPTENNKRMRQIEKEVQTLLRGIILNREKAIRNGEATTDDLLGLLLESNMREMGQNGKSELNLGMTIEEVIEECKLFYFAGKDTTSVLLTWTMIVLSMHPEWQEKAREEVLQHFGNGNGKEKQPDFAGLSNLNTVTMILYEVLRLYTPVSMLTRCTYKTVQLGDVTIPPGVVLGLPILFIHHDTDIWGPDASEFNPTRFARGISKATKDGQPGFFPFGWGPRICIGQNFALLEAKMGLTMILQRFRFELSDKYQHAPCTVITIHPEHGAPIKFHRI